MIRIEVRKRKAPDIGIAPLVDCVLLLLIFFLLTSSFSAKRAMNIELPHSSTADRVDNEQITIMVSDVGEVTFGERQMTPAELTEALHTAVSGQGKRPVLMVADRRVPLEKITAVIDSIREAKLETVAIATSRIRKEHGAMSREFWVGLVVSLAAHAALVGMCDPLHVRNTGEKGDKKAIALVGIVQLSAPAIPQVLPDTPPVHAPKEPIAEASAVPEPAVEPLPPAVDDELALVASPPEDVRVPAEAPTTELAPEPLETNERAPEEPSIQREELPAEVPMAGQDSDAGQQQLTEGQTEDLRSRYLRTVLASIEEAKRYPRRAYRRGLQGTTEIEFTISKDGRASALKILQSSGLASLDAAATKTVSRAAPFHPIPSELETDRLALTVLVAFRIE